MDSVDACLACYDKQNEYVAESGPFTMKDIVELEEVQDFDLRRVRCDDHQDVVREDVNHVANFCVLNYENGSRGRFDRVIFANGEFDHPADLTITEGVFERNYVPSDCEVPLCRGKLRTRSGKGEPGMKKARIEELIGQDGDLADDTDEETNFFCTEALEVNDEDDVSEFEDGLDDDDEEFTLADAVAANSRKRKKKKKKSDDGIFSPELAAAAVDPKLNACEKLIHWILKSNFRNYTILSHNGEII